MITTLDNQRMIEGRIEPMLIISTTLLQSQARGLGTIEVLIDSMDIPDGIQFEYFE